MARIKDRQLAIELRKQGKSYNQIKKQLLVSKSTLSLWLRKYPLSEAQLEALQVSDRRIEAFQKTMRAKREKKLQRYYQEAQKLYLPLSKRGLLLAGILLYWGEGTKVNRGRVLISNTDPAVLKFAVYWLESGLGISRESFKVQLHLYNDMDIQKTINYWSKALRISKKQIAKPYIKKSNRVELTHKGFGHGTCNLVVYNTEIKEKIMAAIQVISDYAEQKLAKT